MTMTDGTGNIKITQRALYGDNNENYVLDRNVRWIAVGEVNPQEYPYTWDFTASIICRMNGSTIGLLIGIVSKEQDIR